MRGSAGPCWASVGSQATTAATRVGISNERRIVNPPCIKGRPGPAGRSFLILPRLRRLYRSHFGRAMPPDFEAPLAEPAARFAAPPLVPPLPPLPGPPAALDAS